MTGHLGAWESYHTPRAHGTRLGSHIYLPCDLASDFVPLSVPLMCHVTRIQLQLMHEHSHKYHVIISILNLHQSMVGISHNCELDKC